MNICIRVRIELFRYIFMNINDIDFVQVLNLITKKGLKGED